MRKYLKELREERKMTQQAIADYLGISQNYYANIENGERQKSLDLVYVSKLAELFKEVEVRKEYLLIKVDQIYKNVRILNENVNISSKNVNISEQKKVEESKVKEKKVEERELPRLPVRIVKLYENNIAPLTPITLQGLDDWLNAMSEDVVEYAISEAVKNNKRNYRYIEAILRNHFNAGRTTLAEVQGAKKTYNKGNEQSVYDDMRTL